MAEQERCEAEDWGDEDDEDVVAAENEYLESWEYKTFEYIKQNGLFESIVSLKDSRFLVADQFDEESKWGDLYRNYIVLDTESYRFLHITDESDDSALEFSLDGEVYPMRTVSWTPISVHYKRIKNSDSDFEPLIDRIKTGAPLNG